MMRKLSVEGEQGQRACWVFNQSSMRFDSFGPSASRTPDTAYYFAAAGLPTDINVMGVRGPGVLGQILSLCCWPAGPQRGMWSARVD